MRNPLGIRLLGLGERWLLRNIAVVQVALLGLRCSVDERVLQPGDVGPVEPAARRGERDCPVPEVLLRQMLVDPSLRPIALPDIDCREVVLLAPVANQDVDAGPRELGPVADLRPLRAGEDDPDTGPVHTVDDPDALRIAVRHEDAEREGVGHDDLLAGAEPEALLDLGD